MSSDRRDFDAPAFRAAQRTAAMIEPAELILDEVESVIESRLS